MALFLGLVLALIALIILRDSLNRFIFHYLMLIIRNSKVTMLVFALLFLPGVALHEFSHWLVAKLLFVKIHRFSLLPEWVAEGTVRFGFVEMSKTDKIRGALIGLAPLLTGVVVILWIAFYHLRLELMVEGIVGLDLDRLGEGIKVFLSTPDVLLWCYLLLAVSNTMLPSSSDRNAWLPAGIVFIIVYITIILVDLGSPTSIWLVTVAEEFAKTLFTAFGVAAALNLALLLPIWLLDRGLKKVRN